jgi:hypothetical protein
MFPSGGVGSAANDKAKAELDRRPAYPTYRAGIEAMVADPAGRERRRV